MDYGGQHESFKVQIQGGALPSYKLVYNPRIH